MKAFESWEKIEGCPGRKVCANSVSCRDCTGERYRGWKAALKWVLINGELLHTHKIITEELSDD